MRSLRVPGQPGASAAAGSATSVESGEARVRALALQVPFMFDSAHILPHARTQLDALAAGIKLLPAEKRVVIEGHTDAVGPDVYNQQLSTRRALAVRDYLVSLHGIELARFTTEGHGKLHPINEQNDRAAENRRVQFRGG